MEFSGKVVEKFVKYLTSDTVMSNEMVISDFILYFMYFCFLFLPFHLLHMNYLPLCSEFRHLFV